MMKNKSLLITVMMVLILALCLPLSAEEKKKETKNLYGSVQVGYRAVDTSGHFNKYKEDYNLDSGARLFNFNLHFTPDGKFKKLFDSLDIHLNNFGGDPFESFDLRVAKHGVYTFKYDRRKSTYFYQDVLEGHDFHHFDFERIADSAQLKVWLCNYARFYFGFERYTKKGTSTTSLDISRDEFEFERPVDEDSKEITLGLDITLKGFTLLFEEKIRDYQNDYHFFLGELPGMGENSDDMTMLNYFYFNEPYDYRSFTHTGRLSARPFANLLFKASAQITSQDMRVSYSEDQSGTTYMGTPLDETYTGEGNFERDIQLFDVDLTYLINNNFAFTGAVRYHSFDQEGMFNVYDVEMPNALDYDTLGVEAGLQYQSAGKIGVSAGFRSESREVNMEGHQTTTKRTGIFGNVKLYLTKALRLTADYQMGSFKDPYTAIAPTDFHRARFTARYKIKGLYFTGSYLYQLSENDINDGWRSERNQVNVRGGYYGKLVKLSLGYGMVYTKNEGDRHFVFYGSPSTWNIFYEGRSTLFDAYLHIFASKKFTIGGYVNYYKNDGSWELERLMAGPFLELKFDGGFLGKLLYRYVDFKESMYGYNNYTANIFEISFGYRW